MGLRERFARLMYGRYGTDELNSFYSKMYAQNQKFLTWRYRMVAKWSKWKERFAQRKTHRFYKCPNCKQKVRVPKGRGKIAITCPKCRTEFIKKS